MSGTYIQAVANKVDDTGNCGFPPGPVGSATVTCIGPGPGNFQIVINEQSGPRIYNGTLNPDRSFSASGSGSYPSGPVTCNYTGTISNGLLVTTPGTQLFFRETFSLTGCCAGTVAYDWNVSGRNL
jgi:hypothetical protein